MKLPKQRIRIAACHLVVITLLLGREYLSCDGAGACHHSDNIVNLSWIGILGHSLAALLMASNQKFAMPMSLALIWISFTLLILTSLGSNSHCLWCTVAHGIMIIAAIDLLRGHGLLGWRAVTVMVLLISILIWKINGIINPNARVFSINDISEVMNPDGSEAQSIQLYLDPSCPPCRSLWFDYADFLIAERVSFVDQLGWTDSHGHALATLVYAADESNPEDLRIMMDLAMNRDWWNGLSPHMYLGALPDQLSKRLAGILKERYDSISARMATAHSVRIDYGITVSPSLLILAVGDQREHSVLRGIQVRKYLTDWEKVGIK